ncbi:MAG: histidine phosphatase family protein [Clostridia bacterium]|nr:histidine phosphatase family protein [Clostridia bacterium]
MVKLIIVRHGNSIGNFKRIFIGQTDWGLSEIGEAQVKRLTEYLKQFHIDEIYSSDLCRAYNTVLPTAERLGLEIHKREGLREIYAGEWEQKTFVELAENFAESYWTFQNDIGNAQPDGGEKISDVFVRIKKAIEEILAENEGKTVLIGTHATVIRVMNCLWHGDTLENLQKYDWVSNAAVCHIEYENGKYNVVEYGHDAHLEGIITHVGVKKQD